MKLSDLAARRKALAVEFWSGHRRNFEFDYALVQAQRDLCEALSADILQRIVKGNWHTESQGAYRQALSDVLALLAPDATQEKG